MAWLNCGNWLKASVTLVLVRARHLCGGDPSEQVCVGLYSMMINFCISLGATQKYALFSKGGVTAESMLFLQNVPHRSHNCFLPAVFCCPHIRTKPVVILGGFKGIPELVLFSNSTSSRIPSHSNPVNG